MKRDLLVPLAVAALARAAPFAYGYEHYGDAPVRIEQRSALSELLLHEQFDTVYDNGSSAVYHR